MIEIDKERKSLFERVLNQEQVIGERERDIELQGIKIESLDNIVRKRDANSGQGQGNAQYLKKIQLLEIESERDRKLVKKSQDKVTRMELAGQEKLDREIQKQTELQKILEQNVQTLEARCELLEMQNEGLKRDREDHRILML